MNSVMSFEDVVVFESFVAFTALERPLSCVFSHVALQMARCHATVVALVTFEWLFSSMVPHHVLFHVCIAAEIAHSAIITLFPVDDPFVPVQVYGFN